MINDFTPSPARSVRGAHPFSVRIRISNATAPTHHALIKRFARSVHPSTHSNGPILFIARDEPIELNGETAKLLSIVFGFPLFPQRSELLQAPALALRLEIVENLMGIHAANRSDGGAKSIPESHLFEIRSRALNAMR